MWELLAIPANSPLAMTAIPEPQQQQQQE